MTDRIRTCPSCGAVMERGTRQETVVYAGQSVTYDQPGWHCDACGDGVVEGADGQAFDDALKLAVAKAHAKKGGTDA